MKKQKGQALISLIAFIAIASTITTAAVSVAIISARSGDDFTQGSNALTVAQTGIENGIVRLLRDENYTGETFSVSPGSATINVTGSSTKNITSVGTVGNFKRVIEVIGSWSNNTFTISSWKEIN
jgi:hypothetical protein